MIAKCSDCKFYDTNAAHAAGFGTCHRYAPSGPVVTTEDAQIGFFPIMNPDNWCGDFEFKVILNS